MILAGSGMCTGGRVLHHLRRHLDRRKDAVVFVGYAAAGTLARQIIDGARHVHIFGHEIPVRAKIHTIGGFSAHADHDELLGWIKHTGTPRTIFLVHGEPDRGMAKMAQDLRALGREVAMPQPDECVELE